MMLVSQGGGMVNFFVRGGREGLLLLFSFICRLPTCLWINKSKDQVTQLIKSLIDQMFITC